MDNPWTIIESYFKDHHLERLTRHQVESYNHFVGHQLQRTIDMFNPMRVVSEQDYDPVSKQFALEVFITFENFKLFKPTINENSGATKLMFPQEARLRNFTYASVMTIDINIKYLVRTGKNIQTLYKNIQNIHIGKLPVMLKSSLCVLKQFSHLNHQQTGECEMDAGGYFIINGSEKVVLGQERAAENKVACYNIAKNNTKYSWIAEMKSVPDFKCISPKQINMTVCSKDHGFGYAIHIQLPRVKQPIPLFIVFRAIGIISDQEICETILLDINKSGLVELLKASIVEANECINQEDAIRYIMNHVMFTPFNMDKETGARKKREFTVDILTNDLFPHCSTQIQKRMYLGYMTNKLLLVSSGKADKDDRDSYLNKRIDLTGVLLNNLFRNYFNKLVKDMEKQIIREINNGSWKSTDDYSSIINPTNIYKIVKSATIENGIKRALSTGDFGIKHLNSNKVGVAQVLNRLTYISSLSHLRRISTPMDKSGKLVPPRKLHNSSWGYMCPAETPEGQSVGLVKNLSYMAHITIPSSSVALYDYIIPQIDELKNNIFGKAKVFINGAWVGTTDTPDKLYTDLKQKKTAGIINVYTGVIFDCATMELRVCNDAGRVTRPLLRIKEFNNGTDIIQKLENGELSWDDMLVSGKIDESVIEYIDPEEQNTALIAMNTADINEAHTHCEIHASTIFGVMGSCIPFPEHNQSPRNCYQCLDANETVLMEDGRRKMISEVKVGDCVISFHPQTFETSVTQVTHHYVRETDKKIYKLRTVSGREIVATEDHKFMTSDDGWCEVRNMNVTSGKTRTKIGIYTDHDDDARINEFHKIKTMYYDINNIIVKNNTLFVEIASITEVENRLISDITVQSDNHSFIAGDNFLSSNCAQGKQAMGVYATNYHNRMDKTAYVLNYPARPLVDTRIMNMLHLNKIPSGSNVIVAIMTHTGYNQEDSLLFNKGSIDRGLFQATLYHTEKDEDKQKINGDEEIRCKPDKTKTKGMKIGNYDKVGPDGLMRENDIVENRDIIIAKVVPIKENRNDHTKLIKFEDDSKIHRTMEETFIDKNYIDRNGDGYNFAKVRLRTMRKPVIGDKFSSRHGQKGTIGNIIPECDVPFTQDGVRPDLIINPHAIPSRMTIGQLKETLLGKVLVELGLFGDGTSFGEFDIKDIRNQLLNLGYESNGEQLMYNGLTGEQHECSVFIGPAFYQRLKHMVNDKTHSRAIGPMVGLTRQPAEGRSRDGGLRIGEMERDSMVSHGISRFARSRLYDVSDKYDVHACRKCGHIAAFNDTMHIHHCKMCDNRADFAHVEIPYACKLLFQELNTMNIAPRLLTLPN